MQFRLHYHGSLTASASKGRSAIHNLRRHFHHQLRELWKEEPIQQFIYGSAVHPERTGFVALDRQVAGVEYRPLIFGELRTFADLEILLLRRAPPGAIIDHGGDLDNRIKILLDALRLPSAKEIPSDFEAANDEKPFYVLLEDDALVTRLSVTTDRLLIEGARSSEVLLIIHVQIVAPPGFYRIPG